jgi:hypothetical protein
LLTNLIFKITVKKREYLLFQGDLNRRMIDLAEQAGAEFFRTAENLGRYLI